MLVHLPVCDLLRFFLQSRRQLSSEIWSDMTRRVPEGGEATKITNLYFFNMLNITVFEKTCFRYVYI